MSQKGIVVDPEDAQVAVGEVAGGDRVAKIKEADLENVLPIEDFLKVEHVASHL